MICYGSGIGRAVRGGGLRGKGIKIEAEMRAVMAAGIAGPMAVGPIIRTNSIWRTAGQPFGSHLIRGNQPGLRAKFGRHVAQGHARPH